MFEFSFEAMGTILEIKVLDQVSTLLAEKIKSEIFDYTVKYDEQLSRFKKDSIVVKISTEPGTYTVPEELVEILRLYQVFYTITDGAINPLVGYTLSDLGYDANYSLRKKETVRGVPNYLETVTILDNTTIQTNREVLIDIGAIGKGFWVDKIRKILEHNKVNRYIINGSGDIYYSCPADDLGVNVGLDYQKDIFGSTKILNQAICGSGTDRRNWSLTENENLHHIVDARTSQPTRNISAAWAKVTNKAYTTAICDGLASSLFFIPGEVLLKKLEQIKKNFTYPEFFAADFLFEYLTIDTNKKTLFSKNFNVDLKTIEPLVNE